MKGVSPVLIGVVLLIGIGLSVTALTGNFPLTIFGGGMTITSIQSTSVITPTTNLENVEWIVSASLTGGSQEIVGFISEDQFKEQGGFKTDFPLELQVASVNELLRYDVINQKVPVWKYTVQRVAGRPLVGPKSCIEAFDKKEDWNIDVRGDLFQEIKERYCVYRTQVGVKGAFENPDVDFTARMILKSRGDEIVQEISNAGQNGGSVVFKESDGTIRGTATWTGSLVSGDAPPDQSLFAAIFDFTDRWHVIRSNTWQDYAMDVSIAEQNLDVMASQFKISQCPAGDILNCERFVHDTVSLVNAAADTVLDERSSIGNQIKIAGERDGTGATTAVEVNINKRITVPQITYRIKADWLGVRISNGQPSIWNIPMVEFRSGEPANILVRVKNIGGSKGTFEAALLSCSKFSQAASSFSTRSQFAPGEEKTLILPISPLDQGSATSETCDVQVKDVENPTKLEIASVFIRMKEAASCEEGEQTFTASRILECRDGKFVVIKECSDGEKVSIESGSPECVTVDQGDNDDECGFLGMGCWGDALGQFGDFIKFILIAIIIILALIVTLKISRFFKGGR